MKRYFYQTPFSEYKPGLITYLNRKNKVVVKANNIYFHEYTKRVVEFYKRLENYYNEYSSEIKKIVDKDGVNLENINEIIKFEMYLYNIINVYQDDTIIEECLDFEQYLEEWIHNIDQDTFLAYFNREKDFETLNDKKIFFDFLSEKPKLRNIM